MYFKINKKSMNKLRKDNKLQTQQRWNMRKKLSKMMRDNKNNLKNTQKRENLKNLLRVLKK